MDDSSLNTQYQDMFTCMSEALILADAGGIIRTWNGGAEHVFGFSATEAVGQSLDLIIPEALRKAHWHGYEKALERGAVSHGGSRITKALHKSGQPLYVDMSFAVVRNRAGKTTGAMAVARDATERYQEEKALRRRLAELEQKPAQQ